MPAAKQQIAASVIEAVRGKGLAEIEKKQPENKRAAAKEVLNEGADLLQKIVKSGRADGAATVLLGPEVATGLMAGYIADGALLDKMLHTIVKAVVDDHPEIEQFVKLDAETLGVGHFHKISIPIPENAKDREKVVQLIGENLDIVIGVDEENAYVAVGRDATAALKKAIEASSEIGSKAVSPVEISIAARPVAGLVATVGKPHERSQAAMVESELKKTQRQGSRHLDGPAHLQRRSDAVGNRSRAWCGCSASLVVAQACSRDVGQAFQPASK